VTRGRQAAVAILSRITTMLWGRPPLLLTEIVDHLGAFGALRWFARNLPPYESLLKKWGPVRTHLLCTEASLLNGCSYCTHAHAYAFELHYFKQRGRVFPIDEHAIVALRENDDEILRTTWKEALERASLPEESALFDRLWRIKFEGEPASDEVGAGMRHLLGMFETLNFCAIGGLTPLDHAHDPINRDEDLKRRYAEARLAAGDG
jgi:hypothetical protein